MSKTLSDEQELPADSGDGTPWGVIALGILIGFGVAFAIVVSTGDDSDSDPITQAPPTVSVETTTITIDGEDNADALDLVVAYGRSRTDDHAVTGEIQPPTGDPLPVRRGILGDRSLDEVGTTAAVVEDGDVRQCELIEGEWLCAPPIPAIDPNIDVQGFATLLLTEEPTYSVFSVTAEPPDPLASITELGPVTCWSMVSDGRIDRARFGAETTFCFHDEIGALVGRVTETSAGTDVFIAERIEANPTEGDVEPSR